MSSKRPALFVDRDGVLNEPVWDPHVNRYESPLTVDAVTIVGGAANGINQARARGLLVVVVSNQPAAAKGVTSVAGLWSIHARVLEQLAADDADVDASYLCLHHPQGLDRELGIVCDCRKPAPGLLLQAAHDLDIDLDASWLIGDTDADVGAAIRAGLAGVAVVAHPLSAHRRSVIAAQASTTVATVADAFDWVLSPLT